MQEIFPSPLFQHVDVSNRPDVAICAHRSDAENIENILETHNITILVHLRDEGLSSNKQTTACVRLYKKFILVLRQYAYYGPKPSNLLQIPLGYMVGMLREKNNVQYHTSVDFANWSLSMTSSMRKYKWTAFIGDSFDRHKENNMFGIEAFKLWEPHWISNHSSVIEESVEIRHKYNDSLFALIGRGRKFELDHYRIYEAIIAGAIPVVIGTSEEINHAFGFNHDSPAIVHAPSWQHALDICHQPTLSQIDERRQFLVEWYRDTMKDITKHIREHLKS
jgi:hypothetical protein